MSNVSNFQGLESVEDITAVFILVILILVSIFSGLIIWYVNANIIMTQNNDGTILKDWLKAVTWGIGVGILTSTIVGILFF